MDIVIEDNIPVPKDRPKFIKHLETLKVGQSFRVDIQYWASLRNSVANLNKRSNKNFVCRKVKEPVNSNKPKGQYSEYIRVWRKK